MADNNLVTRLVYEDDKSSRTAAIKGIDQVAKAQANIAKANATIATSAKTADVAMSKLDSKGLARVSKGANDARQSLKETTEQVETLDQKLERLDANFSKISTQVGQAGDIETGIRTLGGAVGTIPGLQGAGAGAGAVGEIFASLEQLPRLKTALAGLPDIAAKVADNVGLGGVAGAMQSAIPGLSAGAAGIGSLALAAAPLVAALGAIAIGMAITEQNTKKAVAAQEAQNQLLLAEAETRRAAQDFLAEGDTQGLVNTRQEVQGTVFDLTDSIEVLQQSIAEQNAKIEEESTRWNASLIVPGLRTARATTEAELARLVEARTTEIARLAELDTALEGVSEEAINAALNSEQLSEVQSQITAAEQERIGVENQLAAANDRVAQAESQRQQTIEQFAANETRIAEDRTIAETRQLEDRQLRYQEHVASLEQIENAGNKRIEALRGELASLPAERTAALAKIETDGNKKLSALSADYMKKSVADARAFSESQKRTAKDTNTAILRLAQDNLQKLVEAERGNDVISFIRAQEEGATALSRASQDAKTNQERQAQDFAAKQAEQAETQKQRIAEAIEGINAEKQAANDSFIERRAAIQESIDAEKVAIAEQQAAAELSYAKELERLALTDARKAEDQAREDERRKAAHDAQLAQIEERKQKELEAVNAINTALTTLVAKAADLNRQASQITTQSAVKAASSSFSTNPNSSTNTGGGGPFGLFNAVNSAIGFGNKIKIGGGVGAFAEGGIVTKPTLALIGEGGRPEAVVPLNKPSQGLPASFGRNGGMGNSAPPVIVNVTMQNTIGDIATQSMLNKGLEDTTRIILQEGIGKLLMSAIYPTG